MKYIKIFAIGLAALSVGACSDNDDPKWNTESGVVVEMGDATFITKEGRDLIKVPVSIQGERNGNVEITFAIKSDYESAAVADKNLYFTTNTIVVAPDFDTYDLEITIVDDVDLNEARYCDITIESAKGATVGSQNFTLLMIRDNDSEPYDRCAGKWLFKCLDTNGKEFDMMVNLIAFDDENDNYKKYYRVKGLGSDDLTFKANFNYDYEAKEGYLSIANGQEGGTLEVGSMGEQTITLFQLVEDGGLYIIDEGATLYHMNSDFTELTVENMVVPDEPPFLALLFNSGGWYIYDYFYVLKAVRP